MQNTAEKSLLHRIAGLDIVRFLAASAIVFCHIELTKNYRGQPALATMHTIYETGKVAVAAFFALSGFIITLLLLKEKQANGIIGLGNFYARRALRIWPLYYLILALVFFVLPHFQAFYFNGQSEELQHYFWLKLIFCLLLMPQMLLVKFGAIPGGEQLWTIGTEEIFYFLWPLLLSKTRHSLRWAIWLIVGYQLLKFGFYQFSGHAPWLVHPGLLYRSFLVLYYNRIDCLLLGAIPAILIHNKTEWFIRLASNTSAIIVLLLAIALLYIAGIKMVGIDYFFYALLFSVLIASVALKKQHGLSAWPGFLEKMGSVSYGIYLWHFIVVLILFCFLPQPDSMAHNVVFYVLAYSTTWLIAWFSYRYLESPFLRLKDKFRN